MLWKRREKAFLLFSLSNWETGRATKFSFDTALCECGQLLENVRSAILLHFRGLNFNSSTQNENLLALSLRRQTTKSLCSHGKDEQGQPQLLRKVVHARFDILAGEKESERTFTKEKKFVIASVVEKSKLKPNIPSEKVSLELKSLLTMLHKHLLILFGSCRMNGFRAYRIIFL